MLIRVNCLVFISTISIIGFLNVILNQISNEDFEEFTVFLLLSLEGKFRVNLFNHVLEWFQSVEQNHFVVRNTVVSLVLSSLLLVFCG
jgi:hypothetical protein